MSLLKNNQKVKRQKLSQKRPPLLVVDPAQVTVPANGHNIGKQHTVLQGQEGKVDHLDKGPDHPVCLERGPPCGLELLLRAAALHGGHAAEEDADHDGGEGELVAGNAGHGGEALVGRVDAAGEEVEPGGGDGAEDD